MMPRATQVNSRDDPPMLIMGRGCPVTGSRFTTTAMLMMAWKVIITARPMARKAGKVRELFLTSTAALKRR